MRAYAWVVLGLLGGLSAGCKSGGVVADTVTPTDTAVVDTSAEAGRGDTSAAPDTGSSANSDTSAPDTRTSGDAAAASETAPDTEEEVPKEAWTLVPPVGVPAAEPSTGLCVPGAGQQFGGFFNWPELTGRKLELCVNEPDKDPERPTCYTLDIDTLEVQRLKALPARFVRAADSGWGLPSSPDARISKNKKKVEARIGAGSKAPFKRLDTGDVGVERVVSNDRFYATSPSAWTDDLSQLPDARILVFSRESGKRVAEIPLEPMETSCPVIWFAGELLYVEAGVCAGPGATGLFIDPMTGQVKKKLGGLDQSASAYGVAPVALDDGHFAFREQYGMGIFVHDRATAEVLRTINLSATLAKGEDGLPMTEPEGGAMFPLRKDGPIERLVVLQKDRVVLVDPATWTVTRLISLTGCPPTE